MWGWGGGEVLSCCINSCTRVAKWLICLVISKLFFTCMKWAAFTRLQHHGSLSLTPKQPYKCRLAKMLIRFHHLTTHKHRSAANNSVADSGIHFPKPFPFCLVSLLVEKWSSSQSNSRVQTWSNMAKTVCSLSHLSGYFRDDPLEDYIHLLQKSAHLFCPQRIESVVQGLTTGGKCYHCNPHDRSCWCWCPPPPSRSGWWGTDLGFLWKYGAEFKVATATYFRSHLVVNEPCHWIVQLVLKGLITSVTPDTNKPSVFTLPGLLPHWIIAGP